MVWRFVVVVVGVVVVMGNVGNEKKGGKKKESWALKRGWTNFFMSFGPTADCEQPLFW